LPGAATDECGADAAGGVQAMLPPRVGRWWLPAVASLMAWACLSI
jgi:hypothetical protein